MIESFKVLILSLVLSIFCTKMGCFGYKILTVYDEFFDIVRRDRFLDVIIKDNHFDIQNFNLVRSRWACSVFMPCFKHFADFSYS